ncbi:MAG TPA: efflux RND transporter periplasmic adaptor subunit [Burkholderiaceae bacterium]|nr:efflux RND transporter periplasmic adaptor subunit [Burkholderiaceae bacterium]
MKFRFPAFPGRSPATPRRLPVLLIAAAAVPLTGVTIFLVAALSGGSVGASAPAAAATQPQPALVVDVVSPTRADVTDRLPANGSITAWQEASIGTEIGGLRLADVKVNVGDNVKKGQVLAVFSIDTVRAELAQAQAALAEAQATLAEAQSNAARARQVQGSGALSAVQIGQYLTAETTAAARVRSMDAQVRSQQLRIQQAQVRAPDDGVISARNATVGAVLPVGQELFRMIRRNRLEWRAEVTATEFDKIRVGQSVEVTSANGARLQGKVRMLAPTVDPQARTGLVYVDLPVGSAARAGMFARGEFVLGRSTALTVPQQALVVRDGFNYVFEVKPDSRVAQRRVQIGRRVGDRVEITSGLQPDVRLVAAGAGFLNDGDLVRLTTPAGR